MAHSGGGASAEKSDASMGIRLLPRAALWSNIVLIISLHSLLPEDCYRGGIVCDPSEGSERATYVPASLHKYDHNRDDEKFVGRLGALNKSHQ